MTRHRSSVMMTYASLLFIATFPLLTNGFAINNQIRTTIPSSKANIISHSRILTISSSKATIRSHNKISSSSLHVTSEDPRKPINAAASFEEYLKERSKIDGTPNEIPLTYLELVNLPRHPSNEAANTILIATEKAIRSMQKCELDADKLLNTEQPTEEEEIPISAEKESVYANSYVDLSKVSTLGFDYDYTLVTYTQELLSLIYDMALRRLVEEKEYPREMLESGLKFDPFFSIRGEYRVLLNYCFV